MAGGITTQMKIYKTLGKQHNTTNKTIQTQGICKVKNGYTIRHTKNKTTYYYGAYKTLQEATKINTLLQQKNTPQLTPQTQYNYEEKNTKQNSKNY